jgi:hypothetical protein
MLISFLVLFSLLLTQGTQNGLVSAAPNHPAPGMAAVLNGFNVTLEDTYVYGYVDTVDIAITLRLMRGGVSISQVATTASGTGFNAHFSTPVLGGDQIQIELADTPMIPVDVIPLSFDVNKAANIISGTAAPNSSFYVWVYSHTTYTSYQRYTTVGLDGTYTTDFSADIDIFTGDVIDLRAYQGNVGFSLSGGVPGVILQPANSIVYGYGPKNSDLTLTLKSSTGTVKASVADSTTSSGSFSAQFYNPALVPMLIGDSVEVQFAGKPLQTVTVVPLVTQSINPATEVVTGLTLPNSKVVVYLNDSYLNNRANKTVFSNAGGNYSADFATGANVYNQPAAVEPASRLNGLGLENGTEEWNLDAGPQEQPWRNGIPDAEGALSLHPSEFRAQNAASVHQSRWAATPGQTQAREWNSHSDEMINPDQSTGAAVRPEDGRPAKEAVTLDASFDILPGSSVYSSYHDANDNEVRDGGLYAGPYVKVYLNSYNSTVVVGQPNEAVQGVLRNALGAIKGSASGVASSSGVTYLDFLDTVGNSVLAQANDVVEIHYSNGSVRTLTILDVRYIVDRDGGRIYGSGPANTPLKLNYNSGSESGSVTTDAEGNFSYLDSWLVGGYSCQVLFRNPSGDDLSYNSTIPQFTIYPDDHYFSGYGIAGQAYVASLVDSGGTPKATIHGVMSTSGYYSVHFSPPMLVGDRVIVDVGPLHFDQPIVALTVTGNTATGSVTGTAPSHAWLNVFDENNFGPYSYYNYKYFYADNAGNFTASFNKVSGGDEVRVLYWHNGAKDRVLVRRYVPYVNIDPVANEVSGNITSGATGTITIRDSLGVQKASQAVSASSPYGYYYMNPGVDLVAGDQVVVNLGTLNHTSTVIPFSAGMNLATDTVSGTSIPNVSLGVQTIIWAGSYFTNWTGSASLSGMTTTNASGNFSLDYSSLTDLRTGDFTELYYIAGTDTRFQSTFYTTNPTISVGSFPTQVPPNTPVEVEVILANGVHSQDVEIGWDTVSHASDGGGYRYWTYVQGGIGTNLLTFQAPSGGTIYFRAYAFVDGQSLTDGLEHSIDVSETNTTILFDPVSGTTNSPTPTISGVTAPDASVALYQGAVLVQTTTADDLGNFSFTFASPLAPGGYHFSAIATLPGGPGPASNVVHLTVDPSLFVDPVYILLNSRGISQHLRDNNGYANLGGHLWTRSGDTVSVTIPINLSNIYSADLYVGGVFATNLLHSGDGIYVGSYTPPTSGNYALSLQVRVDGAEGPLHTVTILNGLIDPDGYVYDAALGADHRLAGAVVTCYELVDEAQNTWAQWNGSLWSQINPQTVGSDGYYAFFTLPGKYKIKVTLDGYFPYESPLITVVDQPVHLNIPLVKIKYLYLPAVRK